VGPGVGINNMSRFFVSWPVDVVRSGDELVRGWVGCSGGRVCVVKLVAGDLSGRLANAVRAC